MADEEEEYLPAQVSKSSFKAGEDGVVKTEDGETHKLKGAQTKEMTECDPECLNSKIDNLISLNNLNESAILHNLRIRFKEDIIYTYVSTILISVNPFKLLPIFTPEVLDKYKEQGSRNLPPHVFATADNCYKAMLSDNKSQSCVISGESGAGKTEATKLILQYVAEVSGRASTGESEKGGLEQQILQANPVMEAFGNAKTTRNNNSSRFGKLISIKFNGAGAIVGGQIHHYLLEKIRIVRQSDLERNYHIFYQILAGIGADPSLKSALMLTEPEDYFYTNQSGTIHIEGMSDEKEFEDVLGACDVLKINKDEQLGLWKVVAAVLNIGNTEFVADVKATEEDGAKMKDSAYCNKGCGLIGIDPAKMEKSLTSRNIGSRSVILVSYNVDQATDARDALTKYIYSKSFDWLIKKVNIALGEGVDLTGKGCFIHVLDIFGFESFETNSFEQLCINYCNEKLQFHFNEHIFKLEQDEYEKEGVMVDATAFADNQACLDLLEKARTGVFAMIDEEINVPKWSDDGFLSKVMRDHGKHSNFKKPKPKDKDAQKCFNIIHFAGNVSYNVTNFLDKNKDSLHADISAVVAGSDNTLLQEIVKPEEASGKSGRSARGGNKAKKQPTLGFQFKQQLSSLMDTLNTTYPHFVRCMKSNDQKKGDIFAADRMLAQLRYAGLLEVCRIRQIGYPVRREFDAFFQRFKCISPDAKTIDALCSKLAEKGIFKDKEWQKGKNKIFMRNKQSNEVEEAREAAFDVQTRVVQREVRGMLARVNYNRFKITLDEIAAHTKTKEVAKLEKALDSSAELPHKGQHIQIVVDGRTLLLRLQAEERVFTLLTNALEIKNLSDVETAITTAKEMDPPIESPHILEKVKEAEAMVTQLKQEAELKKKLSDAISSRDLDAITSLLAEGETMGMIGDVVQQAEALKTRLEEERDTVKNLTQAMADRNFNEVSAYLEKMAELGMTDNPEYIAGEKLQKDMQEEHNALEAIGNASGERSVELLESSIAKAKEVGVKADHADVKAAEALLVQLKAEGAEADKLKAATEERDLAKVDAIVKALTAAGCNADNSQAFRDATSLFTQLESEKKVLSELEAATAKNDPADLSAALSKASELGMSGPIVDAARAASTKLAAADGAAAALMEAVASGDFNKVKAALDEAKANGMSADSPAATEAESVLKRLGGEKEAINGMKKAMEERNLSQLSEAVANCNRMGLKKKFEADVTAAEKLVEELGKEMKLNLKLKAAQKAKSMEEIDAALAEAAELGIDNEEVKETRKMKDLLVEEQKLTTELEAAMSSKDMDKMASLLMQAKMKGIDNEQFKKAYIIVHRDELIDETKEKIKKASEDRDLALMNEAMEKVIELGMEGPEIEAAKVLRDELEVAEEAKAGFLSAMKVANSKRENPAGIDAADVSPLEAAIMKASGVPDTDKDMVEARALLSTMKKQLAVQKQLRGAIKSEDYNELKQSLDDAEDLILKIDLVTKARSVFREVEKERRRAQAAGEIEEDEFYEEELERERQERLKKAANAKYHFTNYANIRSVDDFAKGVILNKKRVKEGMLKWQGNLIAKSVLELDKDLSKMAVRIHKNILGYMGDKTMSFPATLAQDILQKGLEVPELVDEIYMQIMKQLSNNPKPESIARGWQLMCMCVGTFPPSRDF